ncbi:MAG: 4Fe-4S dicluster domain-containing protein, partial [Anaerolineales bacterium]|nr:4Fe-4S dicluster domain-containing protein [Anaerolineales bacterium]
MLSLTERLLFILLTVICLTAAAYTFTDMFKIILSGQGQLGMDRAPQRVLAGVKALFSQGRILRRRKITSVFHWLVAYAFIFYGLVNVVDLAKGFTEFDVPGVVGDIYRLIADVLSVAGLTAVVYFIVRRFIVADPHLKTRENVLLHPSARDGIARDSMFVALFILLHLGFRFLGESFHIALHGADVFQPFATAVSTLWTSAGMGPAALEWWVHASWWLALGLILVFIPYFPTTKHAHLFMGPLNFMTRPDRPALGTLDKIDFDDETIEQFGVSTLSDLSQTQILDAFACIMCNRCQDACPAYATGKELSPAALEINKRYYIKENMSGLADGSREQIPLMGMAISESAVWACTSCGACVDVCPVGNEPMF